MLHCYGADYLAERSEFCTQYRTRLDIHGLGITAIEVLCASALAAYRAGAAGGPNSAVWAQLMEAWQDYRDTVGMWWEFIYSVFSEGGDFGPVHTWFTQNSVPDQTIQMLERLHQALCACLGVCDTATGKTLRVLVELTHSSSTMDLKEACALLEEGGALQDSDMLRQTPAVIKEEEEGSLEDEEAKDEEGREAPPAATPPCHSEAAEIADAESRRGIMESAQGIQETLSLLTAAFKEGRPSPRMLSFSDRGLEPSAECSGAGKAAPCALLVAAPPG